MKNRAIAVVASCLLACTTTVCANDLLVSSRFSDNVLRYDGVTGQSKGVFASGNGLDNPNGIAIGPDGNLYVGLGDVGRVMVFDGRTGAFLRDFVTPATSGGLAGCRAIAFLPGGDLLVTSGATSQILRYEATTGAAKGVFASGDGMSGPVGLTVGPDGTVYVGAALSNAVYVYDRNGALLRILQSPAGQSNATGVLLDRRGQLLVAESVTNTVQRLDPVTGAATVFASGGGLAVPIGLTFLPGGDLLVGSFNNDKVVRYDGTTGAPEGDFIVGGAGGLDGTHNFAFLPEAGSAINVGHGGAWYDPATSGQGVLVEVIPGSRTLSAYWFTHAALASGEDTRVQRWFVGLGPYAGSTGAMKVYLARGGVFDAPPVLAAQEVGSATLQFDNCSRAVLEYTLPAGAIRGGDVVVGAPLVAGRIELQRIAPATLCTQLAGNP